MIATPQIIELNCLWPGTLSIVVVIQRVFTLVYSSIIISRLREHDLRCTCIFQMLILSFCMHACRGRAYISTSAEEVPHAFWQLCNRVICAKALNTIHCIQYSCTFLISKFDVRLLARFALASFRNSMHAGQFIQLLYSAARAFKNTPRARCMHACIGAASHRESRDGESGLRNLFAKGIKTAEDCRQCNNELNPSKCSKQPRIWPMRRECARLGVASLL